MPSRSIVFQLPILIALVAAVSCDSAHEEGLPSWDDVRIQERGVDGITLGMKYSEIIEKLGRPDGAISGHDYLDNGQVRNLRGFFYAEGKYAGLYFTFVSRKGIDMQESELEFIRIEHPYEGNGTNGLALLSDSATVFQVYGNPDGRIFYNSNVNSVDYEYCKENHVVSFLFSDKNPNKLLRIGYTSKRVIDEGESSCI